MYKDYSNYKNLYLIEVDGVRYEVLGNSNNSAIECLNNSLPSPLTSEMITKIEVIGSANSPERMVYKVGGIMVNKLEEVNYL